MERFKSILAVLTEDSLYEVAFARALSLARSNKAALTLVDLVDAAQGRLGRVLAMLSGSAGTEIAEDVMAYHRERLSGFAARARAEGIEVSEALLQGVPFVEVIRMVLREGHDILIKGATVGPDERATLNGFDMHLLRKCPCPVWILKGPVDRPFRRILATVDPTDAGDTVQQDLDRFVLDLATGLAEREGGEAHAIHAWFIPEEHALRHGRYTFDHQDAIDRLVEREQVAAEGRMRALLADYAQVPPMRRHLVKGLPGDVLAQFADAQDMDLIVMGTVGRTGIAGFITGNTAETVLGKVDCSVLAVKPAGFQSPITTDGDR